MTTIAYKDGVLAADTLCVNGHIRSGFATKIVRGPRGELAGSAGSAGFNRAFNAWVTAGMEGEPPKAAETDDIRDYGFVVLPNGEIEQHEPEGVNRLRADIFAVGSGRNVAQGAMKAGATAEEAVRIAIDLDCYSGGEVTVLRRPSDAELVCEHLRRNFPDPTITNTIFAMTASDGPTEDTTDNRAEGSSA